MNKELIDQLESYFNTENSYWNNYIFRLTADLIENELFKNPMDAILIFDFAIETALDNYDNPLKAVDAILKEVDQFTGEQKYFILNKATYYLGYSEFDNDLSKVAAILEIHTKKLGILLFPPEEKAPGAKDIRSRLKQYVLGELDSLSSILEGMEPVQRLTLLTKIIPYVLPVLQSEINRD